MRRIIWDKVSSKAFLEAISYTQKNSPQNAEKIKTRILAAVADLISQPEQHPPDKYKTNNGGSFRAFELHHFRISYFVAESEVRIVRFRHTRQMPEIY